MKLYMVTYNGKYDDFEKHFECVTNDFDKWLKEHNKVRLEEKNGIEYEEEFDVDEIKPIIY